MFHPKGPTFLELARQCLSSTREGYDLLAKKFDYTPFRTPAWVLEAMAPAIGEPESIGTALDLGCGTGAAMEMLRPLCRDRVVGVDFSKGMLEVNRAHLANAPGRATLSWVRGDLLALPFGPVFDVAVCTGAIGHVPQEKDDLFAEQVAGVLKPGGRFFLPTSEIPSWKHPGRWLSAGFNTAMRLRNSVWKPEFIMFYLTFTLPEVQTLFERHGFGVEVREEMFAATAPGMKLLIATKLP